MNIKKVFRKIDRIALCYMVAGVLMFIGVMELATGHWWRAINSFLYTFIVWTTTKLLAICDSQRKIIVIQHLIIEELEKRLGIGDDTKQTDTPTPADKPEEKKED